jgi:hypothetical protein
MVALPEFWAQTETFATSDKIAKRRMYLLDIEDPPITLAG